MIRAPPVQLNEDAVLAHGARGKQTRQLFQELPLLEPTPGYWERAGLLHASVLARRHKARLADSLIAQACIDHGVPPITRDQDFRHSSTPA